jgi:hypothetical protein
MLAEYFLPTREELPEFDTVKPTSNAEQEILLQKIVTLMPPELDPKVFYFILFFSFSSFSVVF